MSFENESDAAMSVLADALWLFEEQRLRALVTTAERIKVGERRYHRSPQPSSAT